MDSSRRAVEAYWRSRMIDGVTSDEDKVAPVYKLEEVCDLLRTSHVNIVKEVSDHILKRLDHKSPIVKQKALRLIKYAVGKSGADFRKEMQRHSAVMRQLFHYKGHPDPLKGDALNKAVRDTAHEAITALFADANNESKTAVEKPTENIQRRIEGFGNTNYEMRSEEKKSFLSEVVDIGLNTIAAANSLRKTDNVGSYRSPNIRRSLTTETSNRDRYERNEYHNENYLVGSSSNTGSGTWGQDLRTIVESAVNSEDTSSCHVTPKSREERLLETIVTSGGVRLQPTRDAVQTFLTQAVKLDPLAMSRALEMKLQSPLWQVRMKACCVLESILRKKEDEHLSIIASYFSENSDSVVKCSQLPQVSLSEKANKVLSLLDGEQNSISGFQEEQSTAKPMPSTMQMPDLIDTGDIEDYATNATEPYHVAQSTSNVTSSASIVDDLFGDASVIGSSNNNDSKNEDDPFADVSFHVSEESQTNDIFAGLAVDDKLKETEKKVNQGSGLLDDLFSNLDNRTQETEKNTTVKNVHELMTGLSLNGTAQEKSQLGGFNAGFGSNPLYPVAHLQYNNIEMPHNMMFNQAFASQQMNYGAMQALLAQQQLLYQNLGNVNSGYGQRYVGSAVDDGKSSPFPDIFHPSNVPVQNHAATLTNAKKEDTKAFDFISDHVSASRNPKRVL